MSQKVLIVVNADWFFVSHRLRLARAIRAAGYEVHVAAGESEARATIEAEGFTFHPLYFDRGGTNPFRDLRTLFELAQLYLDLEPALVHHVTIKPVVYGGILARILDLPSLNAITGMGHAFIESPEDGALKRWLRAGIRVAWKFVLRGPRAWAMFQNPTDRAFYVDGGVVGDERTFLVPGSGVDTQHFSKQPLPEGPPVLLVPSRLLWTKGIGEFAEAARRLKERHADWRFVLVGRHDPDNPGAIEEEKVRQWLEEGLLEWWGQFSQREMPELYARATLVVLPSYREGLPLAVVEAQAVGRAIVTTDVPGCRNAILAGETGWLVPVRDGESLAKTLEEALTSTEELRRRSENARVFAEQSFAEDRIFGKILEAYRVVLASS